MIPTESELQSATDTQCTCGGGCPRTGCVWCRIYHAVMALRSIRAGLGLDAGGVTAKEVVDEVEYQHGVLCDSVRELRDRVADADKTLRSVRDALCAPRRRREGG